LGRKNDNFGGFPLGLSSLQAWRAELGVCVYCAQISQIALRIKAYFFRVAQFALRIYKANLRFKK